MDLDNDLFSVFEKPSTSNGTAEKDPEASAFESAEALEQAQKRLFESVQSDEQTLTKKSKLSASDDAQLLEALPRIQIHRLETVEACLHEVAVPPGAEFQPLKHPETAPRKEFPFILDPFQKQAILCLENQQSVLVSAHTSAGKTVVAIYAIALSLQCKQRVIYTTPLKALSNQKYRELYEEFNDVGLMTGDVTINPTASCLVMTTEILRSMLYRGSEVMREVAWVIFDEIHYMRDKDRGVVWEETIILLPDNVHYVFLSATIPNARQFAEWICHLHKQPCHVVYTEYRPTPLEHFIYPAGGDGLHLVVESSGEFLESNFAQAMEVLKSDASDPSRRGRSGGPGRGGGDSNVCKLIKLIMERRFEPVIIFSFSRRDCEAYALEVNKMDFNSTEEKALVQEVFKNAVDTLSDEDKKLPQVESVLPLLKKGIGIHHSGLLPLLKETIEILFAEGLIKALFATETFAMGLNMPARTVLFSSARKFDGKENRWITSGEYIQMSGRAGRRGLDDRGIVILMLDEKISPDTGRQIIKGQPDPLNSAFRLTYNMVLNLLRVEEINPEYMLERSFYQFQNYGSIPALHETLSKLMKKYDGMVIENEEQIALYHRIRSQLRNLGEQLHSFIVKPNYMVPFLQPGRLLYVQDGERDYGWGALVNFQRRPAPKGGHSPLAPAEGPQYVAEVLLNLSRESANCGVTQRIRPCPAGEQGEMQVVPLLLPLIQKVSAVRIYLPSDLRPLDNRQSVYRSIQEVLRRFKSGLPELDPVEDMKINDPELKGVVKKIEAFEQRLFEHPLHKAPNLEELYNAYDAKVKLGEEVKSTKAELRRKRSLLQMEELKCRKRVLRRLGYCDPSDVIQKKGRLACEISSVDELLVTELLFNGVFNDVSAREAAALLSTFLFQEKTKEPAKLGETLSGLLRTIQDTARKIAKVSTECKVTLNEDDYVEQFKPHMMDIVHAWASGASFAKICRMTEIFEGSVIRCMRRLEETLREMRQAAKAIGNTDLENKFAEATALIKRDIVFAASLYL